MLKEKYPGMKALSRQNIPRTVKKIELHGTVNDRGKGASGRPRSARSDENIESVRTVIGETPTKSVRMLDNENIISASKSTIHRILRYDLQITPFKISIMQHLKPTDKQSRLTFSNWIKENDDIVDSI